MNSVLNAKGDELIVPDDTIYIDVKAYRSLLSLWHGSVKYSDDYDVAIVPVPVDVMLAKTIPLPHFMCNFEGDGFLLNTYEDGVLILNTNFAVSCFLVDEGDGTKWVYSESTIVPNNINNLKDVSHLLLELWYGIQIALLHPQIKLLFQKPIIEKQYTREGKGKNRKRVVKYVRKHYITAEDIDEALYGHGHRDFERKTMAWYVIGHWRQYKNGTRKFINGYWKGPLREMKRNLDGGRIRQLAIQEA